MISIVKAEQKYAEAITDIYNQAVALKQTGDTVAVTVESRAKWLDEHNGDGYPVFVAVDEGKVVGWLSFSAYRPGRAAFKHTAEVSYYVDGNNQQKGTGTLLLNYAKEYAAANSFTTLIAIILENNEASIKLMKKCGFMQWGFLPAVADFNGMKVGHVYYGWTLE